MTPGDHLLEDPSGFRAAAPPRRGPSFGATLRRSPCSVPRMTKPPRVEQTFYLAAAPRQVFAALTERKQLVRWFLRDASIELREGAPFRFTWHGGYTMNGKVRSVRVPTTVELVWIDRFPRGRVFKTVARFDLKRKGRGTLLTVTHSGFKSGKKWVALYGAIASGWAYYLTNLRSVLEHGVDLRSELDAVS